MLPYRVLLHACRQLSGIRSSSRALRGPGGLNSRYELDYGVSRGEPMLQSRVAAPKRSRAAKLQLP